MLVRLLWSLHRRIALFYATCKGVVVALNLSHGRRTDPSLAALRPLPRTTTTRRCVDPAPSRARASVRALDASVRVGIATDGRIVVLAVAGLQVRTRSLRRQRSVEGGRPRQGMDLGLTG